MHALRIRIAATLALMTLAGTDRSSAQHDSPRGALRSSFETFSTEQGLESPAIMDLIEDGDGNIWIATQEGVVRYDGDRFRSFGQADGLPSQVVFALAQDHDGTLWAATLRGLALLRDGRFTAVELPSSPAGEATEALTIDGEGDLIVGAVGGVYRCEGPFCRRIAVLDADQTVSALAFDPTHGELWFAGTFGLVRWRDRVVERYGADQGLPAMAIRALRADRFGNLWIRQTRALVRLDTADGSLHVETRLPPASDAADLLEDGKGTVWATSDDGLFERTGDRWRRYGPGQGLPAAGISSLLEDHEGSLWIGAKYAGLARWVGRGRFLAWTRDSGLPGDVVWALARTRDGRLAIGTDNGLALVDAAGTEIRILDARSGLPGSYVLSLAADRDGGLWVGLAEGRLAYVGRDGGIVDVGARQSFPPDLSVSAIAVGPTAGVWLATNRGLWEGSGDAGDIRFRRVELPLPAGGNPGARPPEVISDLLVDRDGSLWGAGRYGLLRHGATGWSRITRRDGLLDDYVTSLAQAGDGALWVAYRDARGATELRRDTAGALRPRHFTSEQGLRNDRVSFVRTDALGRVWIGTARGISIRVGDRFASFGRADGLMSEDLLANSFQADADGTAWLGTPNGAIAARLSTDDLAPRVAPEARILEAELGGIAFATGSRPRVSYELHDLEVDLAARTFRDPREIEFRHQLSGIDERPLVTRQRSLRYPALAAGSYTFDVAARIVGGTWGAPARFSFEVLPPWWATVPARVAALLITILIGWALERLRTRRVRRRQLELERQVRARTQELDTSRAELARKNDELAQLALTDPLTGLRNRRYAWEFFTTEVARVDREWAATPPGEGIDANLVFFLLDIDWFKSINDQHGHEVGDQILIEVAERLRHATRIADVSVRWGGEEFLIAARDLPRAEWADYAGALRRAIVDPPFQPRHEVGAIACTSSMGYAAYPFDRAGGLSWQEVLRLADQALRAVKRTGRDADLCVTPDRNWTGKIPPDLLAAQAAGVVDLAWGRRRRAS